MPNKYDILQENEQDPQKTSQELKTFLFEQ